MPNSCQPQRKEKLAPSGIGLNNTRRRLALIYGAKTDGNRSGKQEKRVSGGSNHRPGMKIKCIVVDDEPWLWNVCNFVEKTGFLERLADLIAPWKLWDLSLAMK